MDDIVGKLVALVSNVAGLGRRTCEGNKPGNLEEDAFHIIFPRCFSPLVTYAIVDYAFIIG